MCWLMLLEKPLHKKTDAEIVQEVPHEKDGTNAPEESTDNEDGENKLPDDESDLY